MKARQFQLRNSEEYGYYFVLNDDDRLYRIKGSPKFGSIWQRWDSISQTWTIKGTISYPNKWKRVKNHIIKSVIPLRAALETP